MKHLTREEVEVERLLRATRSVAVLGASARSAENVVAYLKKEGFDVYPVRSDRLEVAGVTSWARLEDVPGSIDLVLVLAGAADEATIAAAAAKEARAVWLAPGVQAGDIQKPAEAHGLTLVRDYDIVAEQRHTERSAGQPRKRGVNVGARRRDRMEKKPVEETGYVPGGGGGHKGGGGAHAVLDEKKMVAGKPRRKRPYGAG